MCQGSSLIYWCIPNFIPSCFSYSLPSSGRHVYLRSYSENICVVDVYGLQFVQCDQLSSDVTWLHPSTIGHTGQIVIHVYPQHRYCLSRFWGKHNTLMMAMNSWNMLGKIWNGSVNQTNTLTHLLVTSWWYYKMLGPTIERIFYLVLLRF
jgi:hypothetical protein